MRDAHVGWSGQRGFSQRGAARRSTGGLGCQRAGTAPAGFRASRRRRSGTWERASSLGGIEGLGAAEATTCVACSCCPAGFINIELPLSLESDFFNRIFSLSEPCRDRRTVPRRTRSTRLRRMLCVVVVEVGDVVFDVGEALRGGRGEGVLICVSSAGWVICEATGAARGAGRVRGVYSPGCSAPPCHG